MDERTCSDNNDEQEIDGVHIDSIDGVDISEAVSHNNTRGRGQGRGHGRGGGRRGCGRRGRGRGGGRGRSSLCHAPKESTIAWTSTGNIFEYVNNTN